MGCHVTSYQSAVCLCHSLESYTRLLPEHLVQVESVRVFTAASDRRIALARLVAAGSALTAGLSGGLAAEAADPLREGEVGVAEGCLLPAVRHAPLADGRRRRRSQRKKERRGSMYVASVGNDVGVYMYGMIYTH